MRRITNELASVKQLFDDLAKRDDLKGRYAADPHRAPEYLDARKWYVLGSAAHLLVAAGQVAPVYAEKQNPQHAGNEPDFETWGANREPWLPVEITEVVHPNFSAEQKGRSGKTRDQVLEIGRSVFREPWCDLELLIQKKAKKHYAVRTCLLLYYDIGVFSFPGSDQTVIETLVAYYLQRPVQGASSFPRVLVINSALDGLAELHPKREVIVPGAY